MNNLLDNELVQKYFMCCCQNPHHNHREDLSERVLQSMQEPIKMYEKALYTHDDGKTWQVGAVTGVPFGEGEFHPTWLRLPDRFQKPPTKEEIKRDYHVCDCEYCGHPETIHIPSKPKPLLEKCRQCGAHLDYGIAHAFCKPKPSPEKCTGAFNDGKECPACKPKDEVEEKIQQIMNSTLYGKSFRDLDLAIRVGTGLEFQLRSLVELARKK